MPFASWLPVLFGGDYRFYLDRIDAQLCALHARHGRLALVGHSAGGWVARLVLGSQQYQGELRDTLAGRGADLLVAM